MTSTQPAFLRPFSSFNSIKQSNGNVSVEQGTGTAVPTRSWIRFLRPFARKAAVVADIGASVAEAVPVLGPSVKGVLEASIKVQRIFEVRKSR